MLRTLYICVIAPTAIGTALAGVAIIPALAAHFYPGQLGPQLLAMVVSLSLFVSTAVGVQAIARCWRKSA